MRVWDSRLAYDPEARALARQHLGLDVSWRRLPSRESAPLADEAVETLRASVTRDSELRRAAVEEVQRVGDRDVGALCVESRTTVVRSDRSRKEYQKALRMSTTAVRLAPWSAYCAGSLAMSKYRTADLTGTLEVLATMRRLSAKPALPELLFKAMALHRLGRTTEAEAVRREVKAQMATSPDDELKGLITEMESVLGNAQGPSPAADSGKSS